MIDTQTRPTTPRNITGSIRRFIAELESQGKPILLPFVPTSQNYRVGYCLSNCEAEQRKTNAQIVFGWIIWEMRSKSFLEAEFHSVMNRSGQLDDITPRADNEPFVLFVRDSVRTAARLDDRTWETWANQKKWGPDFERTKRILLQDPNPNIWP